MEKNDKVSGFEVFGAFSLTGEVDLRVVAGEFLEIVDEMGLVVIAAVVGDIGERFGGAVFLEGSLKANDTCKKFWREAGELFELAFKLAVRKEIAA